MTKIEAYKLLGISRSASSAKAEQAYRNIQKQLCLQLVPGNTLAGRQKAQVKLARLTTAKQTLQITSSPGSYPKNPARRKNTRSKPGQPKPRRPKPRRPKSAVVVPYPKPQTLAEAWELLVSVMPFSEQVIATLLGVIFFLVFSGLLLSLTR